MNIMREKITRNAVYVCIGSAKHHIDSFGPRVGTLLEESGLTVYGTMDIPIHALNCKMIIPLIKKAHPNDVIIAIDAAICRSEEKSDLLLFRRSPIKPGLGIGKSLPEIGNVSCVWYIGTRDQVRESMKSFSYESLEKTIEMASKMHQKIMSVIEKNEN